MEVRKTEDAARANRLRRFADNANWFFKHIENLRADKRYRGRYVAIDKEKVIATAKTIEGLQKRMSRLPESQKRSAYVRFVEPKPVAWILAAA